MEVATPRGVARVDLDEPWPGGSDACPLSLLVLGHGAGGGVEAPDLRAVRDAACAAGVRVARVTQPYRVSGRRAPAPAGHLDEAWTAVLAELRPAGVPLIVGGRSSGARVACRTARAVGASGVVALAFPVHPPGKPGTSRAPELVTGLPTLVINGDRDPFGVPDVAAMDRSPVGSPGAGPDQGTGDRPGTVIDLVVRAGERHDLRRDPEALGRIVVGWLARHGWCRTDSVK